METTIRLKSTEEEIDKLFNNSNNINIRHYKELKPNKYELMVRHSDYRKPRILKCKTIEQLSKINEEDFNYYASKLSIIDPDEMIRFQLYSGHNQSNIMILNLDAIKELKKLISKVERKLKKQVIL